MRSRCRLAPQLIGKLGAQMDAKKKELAAFQEKFKIRVRNNVRAPSHCVAHAMRPLGCRGLATRADAPLHRSARAARPQEQQAAAEPSGSAGGAGVLVQGEAGGSA